MHINCTAQYEQQLFIFSSSSGAEELLKSAATQLKRTRNCAARKTKNPVATQLSTTRADTRDSLKLTESTSKSAGGFPNSLSVWSETFWCQNLVKWRKILRNEEFQRESNNTIIFRVMTNLMLKLSSSANSLQWHSLL